MSDDEAPGLCISSDDEDDLPPGPNEPHVFSDPSSNDDGCRHAHTREDATLTSTHDTDSDTTLPPGPNVPHEFSDASSDLDDRETYAPAMNHSTVRVLEIGNATCPGDALLQRILRREVTSLCTPPPRVLGRHDRLPRLAVPKSIS